MNRRPQYGTNRPQYGYLNNHTNINEHSIDDESDTYQSETGTDNDYGIEYDDLSPKKPNNNVKLNDTEPITPVNHSNNNNNNKNEIELEINRTEHKNNNNVFNDEDNTPSLIHDNNLNETKQQQQEQEEEEEESDTNSFHNDDDRVIEINHHNQTSTKSPKNVNRKKNGYHKSSKSKNGYHRTPSFDDELIDNFLKYKNSLFEQYLFPFNGFTFFRLKFKSQKHDELFPVYIDKQYHNKHWFLIIIMIFQVASLHFIHIAMNLDNTFSVKLDTNLYVMIAFVATLCILLLFALSKYYRKCCNWCCCCCQCCGFPTLLEHSTTSFTLSLGIVLLYLIILYTICGTLTTDRFLVYFLVTLSFNSCFGFIKFTQYIILSFIVMVEFGLCAVLRWQEIITIG